MTYKTIERERRSSSQAAAMRQRCWSIVGAVWNRRLGLSLSWQALVRCPILRTILSSLKEWLAVDPRGDASGVSYGGPIQGRGVRPRLPLHARCQVTASISHLNVSPSSVTIPAIFVSFSSRRVDGILMPSVRIGVGIDTPLHFSVAMYTSAVFIPPK